MNEQKQVNVNEATSAQSALNVGLGLLPCPFYGDVPEFPCGDGTQYEIECDCGMARSCVQISDLMTIDERAGDKFINFRHEEKYILRAKNESIAMWNKRPNVELRGRPTENLKRSDEP